MPSLHASREAVSEEGAREAAERARQEEGKGCCEQSDRRWRGGGRAEEERKEGSAAGAVSYYPFLCEIFPPCLLVGRKRTIGLVRSHPFNMDVCTNEYIANRDNDLDW